jgi:mannose-1-phosphate guanylyltransferase
LKALLLCAGLGTRLRPITNYLPKVLVPIGGKPLLEYWLENLSNAGVDEFLINTHYKSQMIEEFVVSSKFKDNIRLVHEKKLLNTAGPILQNSDFFDDKPFMLVHADNLSFCDFKEFIEAHDQRADRCEITMMLFISDEPSSCGIVELDDQKRVLRFHEKVKNPPSNLANGAVYICEASIIEYLKGFSKKDIDFSNDVIPNYLGRIFTYLNSIYHRDIGTVESYALSQVEVYSKNFNRH